MFESHKDKDQFLKDMSRTKKINRFSEASQELFKDMNHTEIFELCENSKKLQCPDCSSFTDSGIIFCSCGRNLKHGRSVTQFQKDNHDLNSIDGYVIKKNSSRGPKHGQSERQVRFGRNAEKSKETWISNNSLTMGRRGNISVIIDDRKISRGRHLEFRPNCFRKKRLHSYEKRKTTILAALGLIDK